MIVPARFADTLVAAEGEAARAWIDGLPALVEGCLRRWHLTLAGEPMHGLVAVVLPVRRADTSTGTSTSADAVLKLGWPHPESRHEALALRIWGGRGAVRRVAR